MKTNPSLLALLTALSLPPLISGCTSARPAAEAVAQAPSPAVPKTRPPVRESVILLPTKDGKSSGALEVAVEDQQQLLKQPYETAVVVTGERIQTRFSNAEEVEALAGDALRALPAKPVSFTLLFEIDSDKLPADADATIGLIAAEIGQRQVPDVSVIGHTDNSGNSKANFALSQRRAENVYRLIVTKAGKLENVKIEVVGKGDSENAVVNPKSKFEQRNRRVEVFVR